MQSGISFRESEAWKSCSGQRCGRRCLCAQGFAETGEGARLKGILVLRESASPAANVAFVGADMEVDFLDDGPSAGEYLNDRAIDGCSSPRSDRRELRCLDWTRCVPGKPDPPQWSQIECRREQTVLRSNIR